MLKSNLLCKENIGVVGVGGAGGRIVGLFAEQYGCGASCVLVNYDPQALNAIAHIAVKIDLRAHMPQGLCDFAPEDTGKAVTVCQAEIENAFIKFERLILVAPLGGVCGSGATPELLKIARKLNIQTTTVTQAVRIDKIFPARLTNAAHASAQIKPLTDTLIEIVDNTDPVENISAYFKSQDRLIIHKILAEIQR